MTEDASRLAREAKGLHQGLKEALKTSEPWDKAVEFQRNELRSKYLLLLLLHPYAKESKDVETSLWMQTSHAFITLYKNRYNTLDRAPQVPQRPQQHGPRQGGAVELRKLLQRFRQFLAMEDKFWRQLIIRLYRSFGLNEAQSALTALRIISADNAGDPLDSPEPPHEGGQNSSSGRNNFQFPPEGASLHAVPLSPAERAGQLAILTKALVCLGDIARYRELYNEARGRPKAGHEDALPTKRNTRLKRGDVPVTTPVFPRQRNYERAQLCYERARLLVPQEGNPSHQLAILASYHKDLFGSMYHYYRALCVSQPYDTASENMERTLNLALEPWKLRMKKEKERPAHDSSLTPVMRVNLVKESVVALHALWRLRVDKMDSISPRHAEQTLKDFVGVVSERILPTDIITKVIVLTQGALWKHRTTSDINKIATESRILTHLLELHKSLLDIGIVQLAEAPPEDAPNDLSQKITAVFRRTLPALRIASKWLRANLDYVARRQDPRSGPPILPAEVTSGFWDAYLRFCEALSRVFPVERLPPMTAPLEEDIEMSGFLPLKQLLVGDLKDSGDGKNASSPQQGLGQVHPNEEYLMRITDLLSDFRAVVVMDNAPTILRRSTMAATLQLNKLVDTSPPTSGKVADLPDGQDQEEDALTEATSHDDPVADAFRKALNDSDRDVEDEEKDDDQEDEIVWKPGSPLVTTLPATMPSPPLLVSPTSPIRTNFSPILSAANAPAQAKSTLPPTHSKRGPSTSPTSVPATTAQDLLNSVMGVSKAPPAGDATRSHLRQESSAPQPQLLFGSGPPNGPGHSIWSTALDADPLKFQGGSGVGHQHGAIYHTPSSQFPTSSPHTLSPKSIWSPSLSDNGLSAQKLSGGVPTFMPRDNLQYPIGHRRQSSGHISIPSPLPAHETAHPNYDALRYSTAVHHHSQQSLGQHNFSHFFGDLAASTAGAPYASNLHYHNHDPRIAPSPLWGSTG